MLKTLLKLSAIGVVSSVLFTGCSQKEEVDTSYKATYMDAEFDGAPSWVLNPFLEGYICDVGSAKQNAGGDFSLQREEAIADGRNNLVRQIDLKVNNMFKTYKSTTGTGENGTYDATIESVSKQIASKSLQGSRMKEIWVSKKGTMYVLVVIGTNSVINDMDNKIKTSYKDDSAMYQRFLADKAQGELSEELEKMKD